ncbi:amino acid permease [Cyathus striatus]|nr:amino acid permease [Cyathus striatus]
MSSSETNNEKNQTEDFSKDASDTESARDIRSPGVSENGKLVRQLKNRHVAMISIGGVIGTGLFLGSAIGLRNAGPVGLLLGYTIIGTMCYSIMISLGEMVSYLPIAGGHIKLAERFVNPALSFAMGWNYWYNWTINLPGELTASAVLIGFWDRDVNPAVWVTVTIVVTIAINMLGAGAYGEAEFIFASIKVITIIGLIILGIVLDLGGGPNHDRIGFRYWKNPGPFAQFNDIPGPKGRFLAWWSIMPLAALSFIGTETVAIAAGETKNPRRNLPKAIKRVYMRILLFYIGGTAIIGLLVPHTDERLSLGDGTSLSSPFVIAIQNAGISVLPSIINACLLTSAWSAACSDLYISSRALYGLSLTGNAPRIFSRTSKGGLPYISVGFCALFATIAYAGVRAGAGRVFGWFISLAGIAGLTTWFGISVTYLRFYSGMKAQGYDRNSLPYASKLQPFAAWYAMIACLLIIFLNGWSVFLKGGWSVETFVTSYIPLVLFVFLYFGAKLYYRQPSVKAEEMDFETNVDEIEADIRDEPPPKNKIMAFWQWLM